MSEDLWRLYLEETEAALALTPFSEAGPLLESLERRDGLARRIADAHVRAPRELAVKIVSAGCEPEPMPISSNVGLTKPNYSPPFNDCFRRMA